MSLRLVSRPIGCIGEFMKLTIDLPPLLSVGLQRLSEQQGISFEAAAIMSITESLMANAVFADEELDETILLSDNAEGAA